MPVSLIPGKAMKERVKFKTNEVFWAFISTALFLLLLFLGLKIYQSTQSAYLDNLKAEIVKLDEQRDLELEKEIQVKIGSLNRVEPILDSHQRTKNIFDFLEKNTLSDVEFLNFNFNAKENSVVLKGNVPSANILIMQISIFEGLEEIEEVEVSGITISEEGVKFQLKLKFRSVLFNF